MSTQMAHHDYVVVGAGAAGCIVASRLAETGEHSVLLLESGPWPDDPRITRPGEWYRLIGSELDWQYRTVPQAQLGNRVLHWPRGRMVGGSAGMNALVYIRGNDSDFDHWREWGGEAWGAKRMSHLFERVEHRRDAGGGARAAGSNHIELAEMVEPHPFSVAFVESAVRHGLPRNTDFNGLSQEGVGYYRTTRTGDRRSHPAQAYLRPTLARSNLTVVHGVHATQVVVRAGRAVGVRYVEGEGSVLATADREVVLCAGTIGTAHLLLLSGIGPGAHLRQLGIPVVADLRGVGENLHDHPQAALAYPSREHRPLAVDSNLGEAGGFVSTRAGLPAPDIQFSVAPMLGLNRADRLGCGISVGAAVTRPRSRGRLRLRSADPSVPPDLDPRYLTQPDDLATLVAGLRLAHEIIRGSPLVELLATAPGPVPDDEACVAFVRANAETQFHPVGTCRFGTDDLAVTDPALRVHGVAGLRVADASIMPAIVTGNPQAAVFAIAEQAADLIKEDVS